MIVNKEPTLPELKIILFLILPLLASLYYYFSIYLVTKGEDECRQYCITKGYEQFVYRHLTKNNIGNPSKKCHCKKVTKKSD